MAAEAPRTVAGASPAPNLPSFLSASDLLATKKQALRSRVDDAGCQRTTGAFLPWFPRKS
jgi:hypothetical protein